MPIYNEMTKADFVREAKRLKRERWEIEFSKQLEAEGYYLGEDPENLLPGEYIREFRWHPKRRWRADFLIVGPSLVANADLDRDFFKVHLILVEIEGGVWTQGRHTRGSGFIADCEKYNHASALGWKVFRFVPEMIKSGEAIEFLKKEVWRTK